MKDTSTSPLAGAEGAASAIHTSTGAMEGPNPDAALVRSRALSQQLGSIVTVMMRSPEHRKIPLGDLDRLLGPAIATGQVAIVEAKTSAGVVLPVAAVTWAMVSEEVDQRLSDIANARPRLDAADWRSGSIPWIITAVGENKVLNHIFKHLIESQFQTRPPKIRLVEKDGQAKIGQITVVPEAAAAETDSLI